MNTDGILVIVPAYNEGANIKKTIQEIYLSRLSPAVLVVDDGSSDATSAEARAAQAWVATLPFNTGIGGAVQTGFQFALNKGFSIAAQIDGDGQHDAAFLEKLIEPILKNEADMTIGSRFLPPHLGYRSSFVRRIGINFFSRLISFLCRVNVTDPTSGFRAYNQKAIKLFAREYPHDFPEPEAVMVASRYGMRIVEVPVVMRKRQGGLSSIRYFKTLYYMVKVTVAILLSMLKKKRKVV